MPKFESIDWYRAPLYYDIVFETGTEQEAALLSGLYARYVDGRGRRRVLEPGCGTGRLMAALGRRGFTVSGLDVSAPMLAFARQRLREQAVRATLRRAPMESFRVAQRFDFAHCLVSTFKYLLTEDAARAHLQCVAEALRPGGVYALGLHLVDEQQVGCTRERWTGERDGVHVTCNIQDWPADLRRRRQRLRSRLVVREAPEAGTVPGAGEPEVRERRYETHWQFRTYTPDQLRRLIASVPSLELVAVYPFDGDADTPTVLEDERLDKVLVLRRR